jgi:hypothetical protein
VRPFKQMFFEAGPTCGVTLSSLDVFECVAQGHCVEKCRYEPTSDYLSDTDSTRFFAVKLTGLE